MLLLSITHYIIQLYIKFPSTRISPLFPLLLFEERTLTVLCRSPYGWGRGSDHETSNPRFGGGELSRRPCDTGVPSVRNLSRSSTV